MAFLTDRKRATGLGASKTGTEHHWQTQMSSIALLILTLVFFLGFGQMLGESAEAVVGNFARPYPAVITGLMLVVGFSHFRHGVQVLLEDYTQGLTRKLSIIAMACLSYGAMAVGLFALVKLAL